MVRFQSRAPYETPSLQRSGGVFCVLIPRERTRKTSGFPPANCRCPLVGCVHRWRATLHAPRHEGGLTCSFTPLLSTLLHRSALFAPPPGRPGRTLRSGRSRPQRAPPRPDLPRGPRRAVPAGAPRMRGAKPGPPERTIYDARFAWNSCLAVRSARKASRPPGIRPRTRPMTGSATPTGSTPTPLAGLH